VLEGYERFLWREGHVLGIWGRFAAEEALLGSNIFRPYLNWSCPKPPLSHLEEMDYQRTIVLDSQGCSDGFAEGAQLSAPEPAKIERHEGVELAESGAEIQRGRTINKAGFFRIGTAVTSGAGLAREPLL
jgi:hypothetical protein